MLAGFLGRFALSAEPGTCRVAPPIVEAVGDTADSAQAAQVVIEFSETRGIPVALILFLGEFANATLDGNGATGDANAKLRDVKPVGRDDLAGAGIELDVVVHASRIRGVKRVDKGAI